MSYLQQQHSWDKTSQFRHIKWATCLRQNWSLRSDLQQSQFWDKTGTQFGQLQNTNKISCPTKLAIFDITSCSTWHLPFRSLNFRSLSLSHSLFLPYNTRRQKTTASTTTKTKQTASVCDATTLSARAAQKCIINKTQIHTLRKPHKRVCGLIRAHSHNVKRQRVGECARAREWVTRDEGRMSGSGFLVLTNVRKSFCFLGFYYDFGLLFNCAARNTKMTKDCPNVKLFASCTWQRASNVKKSKSFDSNLTIPTHISEHGMSAVAPVTSLWASRSLLGYLSHRHRNLGGSTPPHHMYWYDPFASVSNNYAPCCADGVQKVS